MNDNLRPEEIKFDGARDFSQTMNWFELRLQGKHPDRRGYHSSFIHDSK